MSKKKLIIDSSGNNIATIIIMAIIWQNIKIAIV